MKNLTNVEKVRQENAKVKAAIEAILDWHNDTFCQFQYEMGYEYLNDEIRLDSIAVQELSEMKEFWAWWRNQWAKRDIAFLETVLKIGNRRHLTIYRNEKIVDTYKKHHQVDAINFSPHKTTMRESYSRFIGKLNKSLVK